MNSEIESLRSEVETLKAQLNQLQEFLKPIIFEDMPSTDHKINCRPTVAMVRNEVSRWFSIRQDLLLSHCREQHIAWARQVGMFLAYDMCDRSAQSVAKAFNRTDHGTVIWARHAVSTRCEDEPQTKLSVDGLRVKILGRVGV